MDNAISQKFTTKTLIKFAFPTIAMMVFLSIYTMIDAVFVSNLIGENALAALNIAFPFINILMGFSVMLATGGGAIIGYNVGEGRQDSANSNLSVMYILGIGVNVVLAVIVMIWAEPLIHFLGSTPELDKYTLSYLMPMLFFIPINASQILGQFYIVTAGKPHIGLVLTVIGGISNIVLDYVFIAIFDWGISGAAIATGIGYSIPGLYSILFFFNKKNSLHFGKPVFDYKTIWGAISNGISEMVTSLSTAVTTIMFNIIMLDLVGESGVAAMTAIFYLQFLQVAIHLGFSSGVSPIFSYNFGCGDKLYLDWLHKTSTKFTVIISIIITVLTVIFADFAVGIFISTQSPTFALAKHGLMLFSISCLTTGINVYASALFTALSNGKISAIISLARTFVFIVASLLILPKFLDVDGVFLAIPLAETLAIFISLICIKKYKDTYFRSPF